MAERRMFAKTIIDSDAFLDMPVTSRLLYYDLSMRADDDGFVNAPKKIMRMIGAAMDDLRVLVERKFIIPFDNGVVVIKHWRIHNYIRKDTYHETKYTEQKALLEYDENSAYRYRETGPSTERQRAVNGTLTQVRLGKDSIGKVNDIVNDTNKDTDNIDYIINNKGIGDAKTRQIHPTVEDVREYCRERGNNVDPEKFVDYYSANGWKVGKNPMKDWKAAVRTWERNGYNTRGANGVKVSTEKDHTLDGIL